MVQRQIPGAGFVDETGTAQRQIPGIGFVDETVTATVAANTRPAIRVVSQALNRAGRR